MSTRVEANQRTPFTKDGTLTKYGVDLLNGLQVGQTFGARWRVTAEAETVIAASGTAVKMAGVTTGLFASGFQVADNAIIASRDITCDVVTMINVDEASATPTYAGVRLRVFRKSTATYEDFAIANAYAPSTVVINCMDTISFLRGDILEVWLVNQSNSGNLTAEDGSYICVKQI